MTEKSPTAARILCVEDESLMLDLLRLILERAGYVFSGVQDGAQALEMMRTVQPDLVLLDLMLPNLDGAEVLLRKKKDPAIRDIPVIAVTALVSPFDQIMWKRHTEIKDYVTKPFKRQDLLDAITRVLAEGSGVNTTPRGETTSGGETASGEGTASDRETTSD